MIESNIHENSYATSQSAGFDIKSAEDIVILPNDIVFVKTGLYLNTKLPFIYKILRLFGVLPELQIRPKSGSISSKLQIVNTPGTVDWDYVYSPDKHIPMSNFEIKVKVRNITSEPVFIKFGEKIAQGVFGFVYQNSKDLLVEDSIRKGGFGSTSKGG